MTSALIAFLELFCDSGCSVKNKYWSDNVLSNVLRGICGRVGLPMCLTVCAICVVLGIIAFFFFLNEEPEFWLLLYKFKTQVEVMLYRTSDKEGITSAWQLMEDYLHQLLYGYTLMYLCFSWILEVPKSHRKRGVHWSSVSFASRSKL